MIAQECCVEPQWAILHHASLKMIVFLQLIFVPAAYSDRHMVSKFHARTSALVCLLLTIFKLLL